MKNKQHKNSKTQKWPGISFKATSVDVSREEIFQSGILKLMPQGTYYTGDYPRSGKHLQVCITRDNPDGTISFFLAAVEKQTGKIISAMIEFGLKMSQFRTFLRKVNLDLCEDKLAAERFLIDSNESHARLGIPFPAEFNAGLSALWYDNKDLENASLLAPFQHELLEKKREEAALIAKREADKLVLEEPLFNANGPIPYQEKKYVKAGEDPAADYEQKAPYTIPDFDPNYCKDWDTDQWSQFINRAHSSINLATLMTPEFFNPYLILFKQVFVPYYESRNPKIMKELEWLAQHPPKLIKEQSLFIGYKHSFEEIKAIASLQAEYLSSVTEDEKQQFVNKMNGLQIKYPQNPVIAVLLHQLYWDLEFEEKRLAQACRLYENFKYSAPAITRYLMEIRRHQKKQLMEDFLNESVLLEKHLSINHQELEEQSYFHYYHSLARHFSEKHMWPEFSKLMEIALSLISETTTSGIYDLWYHLYIRPVIYTHTLLSRIEDDFKEKELLLDNVLIALK